MFLRYPYLFLFISISLTDAVMTRERYTEEKLLQLSGIQHYCFCPRQWAITHVEQTWEDNQLTALGQVVHQRVNRPEEKEKRKDRIILRSVPLVSYQLGLYGLSDAVELTPMLTPSEKGFSHPNYPGQWQATPIEYKRGRPKQHNADKLQLCAEAICLEEMYAIHIPTAYLYYELTKHRLEVVLDEALRQETLSTAIAMHRDFEAGHTPSANYTSKCKSCSLQNHCLPKMTEQPSVKTYFQQHHLF